MSRTAISSSAPSGASVQTCGRTVLHYYVGMSASAVAETLDIPKARRNRACIEP